MQDSGHFEIKEDAYFRPIHCFEFKGRAVFVFRVKRKISFKEALKLLKTWGPLELLPWNDLWGLAKEKIPSKNSYVFFDDREIPSQGRGEFAWTILPGCALDNGQGLEVGQEVLAAYSRVIEIEKAAS